MFSQLATIADKLAMWGNFYCFKYVRCTGVYIYVELYSQLASVVKQTAT